MIHGQRLCGPCKACCKTLPVSELHKQAGQWCDHVCGTGCQIYATRPESCRQWSCGWLTDTALPSWLRPDLSHVIFDPMLDWIKFVERAEDVVIQCHVMWCDPRYPNARRAKPVLAEMDRRSKASDMPWLIRFRENRAIVVAPPSINRGVWGESQQTEAKPRDQVGLPYPGLEQIPVT